MQQDTSPQAQKALARAVGATFLAMIALGIGMSIVLTADININLSADIAATAENMLDAEQRLRAKGYFAALVFAAEAFIAIGLFALLRAYGVILAAWCLSLSLAAALLTLLGGVYAMNAAHIGANSAFADLEEGSLRLALASLQATSDYTSFHLGLIIGTAAKGGFFYLFLRSGLIPALISGWGVFASVFVVSTIMARDFIPVLGHNAITMAFMLSNLVAVVSMALYLAIRGVRSA